MKTKLLFLFLLSTLFTVSFATAENRRDQEAQARDGLLNLNFFAEGRGMNITPNAIAFYDIGEEVLSFLDPLIETLPRAMDPRTLLTRRWGITVEEGRGVGLFTVPYKGMAVGVLGCVACHSGRAAGRLYVGLGNKNIDVQQVGKDATFLQQAFHVIPDIAHFSEDRTELARMQRDAVAFTKRLSRPDITNLTQGLVPVSTIKQWFYDVAKQPMPRSNRGQVKVPAFWGYGEKRKIGQFCDGFGDGVHPGWGVAVEFVGGQRPEVVQTYIDKIEAAEESLKYFLPPAYPYAIDRQLAQAGKSVFQKNCASCHGTYENDEAGLPIYKAPRFVPLEVVGTDDERLGVVTDEFKDLIKKSPLHDVVRNTNLGRGYFAYRLHGIWARFPYMHNGSVPNLAAMLTRPSERPRVFSLVDAGEEHRFDSITVGLKTPKPGSVQAIGLALQGKAGFRATYDVGRVGHSNKGHPFGTDLPAEEKKALIEYLKTL